MRQSQVVTRWIGSMAAIAAGLCWLHLLGGGDLGAPPLSINGAALWLEQRDTAVAAFALLRLVALGFGWYLLVVTAIGGAARALQLPRMTSAVESLTLPFARGLLGGVALLGVMAAPPPVAPAAPDAMIELSPDPTSTTVLPDNSAAAEHATLHLVPDTSTEPAPAPLPAPAPTPTPEPASAPAAEPTASSGGAHGADTWEVQHGESFWSIAAEHLAEVSGHSVSEREVGSYWRQVVEHNRSRLANPNDADLLFTGQLIELPAVAPG